MEAKVDNNHFGKPMAGQPYESAWRNWREHSLLLVNRHPGLLKHGKDFRAWARGLEKAGYNKSDNYANQLLEIIDRFHLEQLDESTI
jgi:flagellum-specific peptidoglycan hydrolase FlgJ